MATQQTETHRPARFAAYIEARRFDPPRPLLIKAAGLTEGKGHALDVGAGALNATKYLLSEGFGHVTVLDSSPQAQKIAEELPGERVTFFLSRFEDFTFPAAAYDLIAAEFSLPFMHRENFAPVFTALLGAVRPGGIFAGQLFGPNDSWNVASSAMSFHSRSEVEEFFRNFELVQLDEEDNPGKTKLGEDKHWHIFHILARRSA